MAYQNLDLYILETLAGVMAKYKQKYCVMSQDKFLKLLKEFYEVKISKRTLNYHLRKLEDQKYIKRERRIKRRPDGTLQTLTTCYFLQEKAYHFIFRTMAIFGRFIKNSAGVQKMDNNYFLDYCNFTVNTYYRKEKKEKKKEKQSSESKNISQSRPIQNKQKTYEKAEDVSPKLQSGNSNFDAQEDYVKRLKKQFAIQRERRLANLTPEKRQKMEDIISNKKKVTDFEDRRIELLKQAQYLKQIGF